MCKGIINVMRSDIIIDGSDAKIEVNIKDCTIRSLKRISITVRSATTLQICR